MLDGLTYKTYELRSVGGYDFGDVEARIRSPHSSLDSIWSVDTTHAAGGARKRSALIHEIARSFIERAAQADLRDDFADRFEGGLPGIFLYFDGGEDRCEETTKVVVVSPDRWRLMGSVEDPWRVSYSGLVFEVEETGEDREYHGDFWNDEWMEQVSIEELHSILPEVAGRVAMRLPGVTFAEPATTRQHAR